ncbi:hypothetical protein ABG067_001082 [Albugo candida]|uniref:Uncharacterized protein n=1 Tax=Albugo candida TaxID=65357 RepID=A0A024GB56_9STRA|nr:unnamed protein product [Albugo candida]|eukprot:CCI43775.1 unnamed protein product [Albugo candida]
MVSSIIFITGIILLATANGKTIRSLDISSGSNKKGTMKIDQIQCQSDWSNPQWHKCISDGSNTKACQDTFFTQIVPSIYAFLKLDVDVNILNLLSVDVELYLAVLGRAFVSTIPQGLSGADILVAIKAYASVHPQIELWINYFPRSPSLINIDLDIGAEIVIWVVLVLAFGCW